MKQLFTTLWVTVSVRLFINNLSETVRLFTTLLSVRFREVVYVVVCLNNLSEVDNVVVCHCFSEVVYVNCLSEVVYVVNNL